ncbi:T9SS C-terminal target domain-containing protein [Neptunitalea sp. Y10]|uniref:T9SS C-terminal target domain-containing protein n=2 Tax=Neptunitalea lumnitzerae TaxID=2965509 RepID=A0ABQ5MKS3_9FLAO|nr:T9SS C-terminal target domain-containing protein [Neptunitalea sp. Y10]
MCKLTTGQNIQVNSNLYSAQELVEDILINSDCITDIHVTNTVSGNFSDGMKSFGYFSAMGTTFPFERGIVMSTGRLNHVPGPNNTLSDDDAPNWGGDTDLNNTLGINNTLNATVLEFDFTPNSDNIRFNYIFASEEYQENNSNTCIYSDVFAFLIKPQGGNYTNIAVVPNTNIPVQVTTVHPEIPGGCAAENETYFGSFNNGNAPINFNGQTAVLTAEAAVVPNTVYHIKLIIADEQNYRYDSAVFLEAESFTISANLGDDRSFANDNPVCANESIILTPTVNQTVSSYSWYKDDILLSNETSDQLVVTEAGSYEVVATLANGCSARDEVIIDYSAPFALPDITLNQCDTDGDGLTVYDLNIAENDILANGQGLQVSGFYASESNAINGIAPFSNPDAFYNTTPNQVVYAGVINEFGCTTSVTVHLNSMQNNISNAYINICDSDGTPDGYTTFNLNEATSQITGSINETVSVSYFLSAEDAFLDINSVGNTFTNTTTPGQTLYARVDNQDGCFGIGNVYLRVYNNPTLPEDTERIYCTDSYPATINLTSGVQTSTYLYDFLWSNGETTPNIHINEPGNYSVTITNYNGCSTTRNIKVIASSQASVSYEITGNIGNNNAIIYAEGNGNYVYSLDGNTPQNENVFYNLTTGPHTVFVEDLNGCSSNSVTFYIIDFPNYFTPNNDGVNDTWNILGDNYLYSTVKVINIFDRYGKLVYSFKPDNIGWDGTYNNKAAPSTDYWFSVTFNNGDSYFNNFSLIR